jgi:hypothetical protein
MSGLEIGLIVAAFSIILGAIIAYNVRQAGHIADMREEIAILRTRVSPLWAQIQTRIATDLHHPHPRYLEMDTLLEKLELLTITPAERERLEVLLLDRSLDMHDDITEVQRKEAQLMSQVMHIVVLESKGMTALILGWLAVHFWR